MQYVQEQQSHSDGLLWRQGGDIGSEAMAALPHARVPLLPKPAALPCGATAC